MSFDKQVMVFQVYGIGGVWKTPFTYSVIYDLCDKYVYNVNSKTALLMQFARSLASNYVCVLSNTFMQAA